MNMEVPMLPEEYWWGGKCYDGTKMPFSKDSDYEVDLRVITPNQAMPVLLSSKGRYIIGLEPLQIKIHKGIIQVKGACEFGTKGNCLKSAYKKVAERIFIQDDPLPPTEVFSNPIYAGWIDMGYYPTQEKVLAYVYSLKEQGYPPGIFILDDCWMKQYGNWEFDRDAFPDPQEMIRILHQEGFQIILWVVPYVTPVGAIYRKALERGVLLTDETGEIVYRKWWNGISAVLDLTKIEALDFLKEQLDDLVEKYDIDGFKFDGGIPEADGNRDLIAYCMLGRKYKICEIREGYMAAGSRLLARQSDKQHSWTGTGLNQLIPNGIAQSLMGYWYHCPDMIGGGDIDDGISEFDPELYIRYAQCALFFPIIQFSRLPYKVLSQEQEKIIRSLLKTREKFVLYLLKELKSAEKEKFPVFVPLAFYYPHQGLEEINTEFSIGENMIVAPVLKKNCTLHTVVLPEGTWEGFDHHIYAGGVHEIPVTLEDIPFFIKRT